MKRIAVLTGSFNPPTLGHLSALTQAVEALGAEKGIFLPASDIYVRRKMAKKGGGLLFTGEERLAMLTLMCEGKKNLVVCPNEINGRADSNYTYKSMRLLAKAFRGNELHYIIGADQLANLPHWHDAEDFLEKFHFLVFEREGYDCDEIINGDPVLEAHRSSFTFAKCHNDYANVSSTKVRKALLNKDSSFVECVDEKVAEYLKGHFPF